MSSAIAILERLLDEESINSKEHVIETASRHVSNVEARLSQNFDNLVNEITMIWGMPQFNSTVPDSVNDDDEEEDHAQQSTTGGGENDAVRKKRKLRNVVPPWSNGTSKSGGQCKALRLSYWKRPNLVGYVVLRADFDTKKNVAITYDLILGARRRGPDTKGNVAKLKQAKGHWFTPILNWLSGR